MIIKRKDIFLGIYLITMLCLFFAGTEYMPFTSYLAKAKYLYWGFCIVDIFTHKFSIKNHSRTVFFILFVYLIFAILYGKVLVNDYVIEFTNYQFKNVMLSLITIFLTYYEIESYKCFEDWCLVSFASITLLMTISMATHLDEVSKNPIYWLKSLRGEDRTQATFGLEHWNLVGFFCYVGLILSYFCYRYNNDNKYIFDKKIIKYFILLSDLIFIIMIGTVASRSAITAALLFFGLIILYRMILKIHPKQRKNVTVFMFLVIIIILFLSNYFGLFEYIWNNSHRIMNIENNLPGFKLLGDFWTGMGWVDNSAFQDTIDAFGYGSSSLDLYYVYLYFTTGCIGCIFMAIVYGCMAIKLFFSQNKDKFMFIALLISILYYMYWDTVLFTVKFWQGIIIVVILLHGMSVTKGIFIKNKKII